MRFATQADQSAPPGSIVGEVRALPRSRADLAELAWVWTIVGYSLVRFVIAWGAFSEHGANAWVFGLIDVGTAWPYAKSVAQVCRRAAASEWSRLPVPLVIALVTFFAPYAYLWFAAGEMPAGLRMGMVLCVSLLLLAATAGALSKTRKLRRASTSPSDADVIDLRDTHRGPVHDGPTELVIDLTQGEPRLQRSPI